MLSDFQEFEHAWLHSDQVSVWKQNNRWGVVFMRDGVELLSARYGTGRAGRDIAESVAGDWGAERGAVRVDLDAERKRALREEHG